jgi:catechol 2,3-dioxygenase-like lactoylglutathione lyase family enzyme
MRALSVLHPVITVSNMDVALRFYRDLLGLEVVLDYVHDPKLLEPLVGVSDPDVRAAILKCPDGTEIELAEFRRPPGKPFVEKCFEDAGITFVTLVVDDIEALVSRLQGEGFQTNGPIVEYPSPTRVRVVYCFGPDGTPLTLVQFLKAA